MSATTSTDSGLEGIIATSSAICSIDGLKGILKYRGYDIHDLAQQATFDEVIYLLWHGELPTRSQVEKLSAELRQNYALPQPVLDLIRSFPRGTPTNPVLRTAYSALA